ncbi:MAG: 4-hydroxythreonine-4-phosphate dehydrogenase PdxA [Burkholderiaceae bacterium]
MNDLPVLGLMLGDMTGIGPEISARLLSTDTMKPIARIVVIGDARVLELGRRDAGVELKWQTYKNPSAIDWSRPETPLIDLNNIDPATIPRGAVSPESGKQAGATLKTMIDLALGGEIDAVCFAPLNKAALHKGGWNYHDEHQMFADLTWHSGFFGEMNVIKEFATFRVTSHVALREALAMITTERIMAAVRLADTTLRAEGVRCSGPVPSDVVFIKALKGDYDGQGKATTGALEQALRIAASMATARKLATA